MDINQNVIFLIISW